MPRNEALARAHLQIALKTTVPLIIYELQRSGGVTDDDIKRTAPLVESISSHGDDVLFSSEKKNKKKQLGTTDEHFASLARGIAILAFQPGGVTVFEEHFEVSILRCFWCVCPVDSNCAHRVVINNDILAVCDECHETYMYD